MQVYGPGPGNHAKAIHAKLKPTVRKNVDDALSVRIPRLHVRFLKPDMTEMTIGGFVVCN